MKVTTLYYWWRKEFGGLPKKFWNKERCLELWKRHEKGESPAELASEIGETPDSLRRAWKRVLGKNTIKWSSWTKKLARETWDRYVSGEKSSHIARDLGVCQKSMRSAWKYHLGKSPDNQYSWSLEICETTWARWENGEACSDMARELGVSPESLRSAWLRYLGKQTGGQRRWTMEEAQTTWDRYQEGESSASLAAELGTSSGALLHAWKRLLGKRPDNRTPGRQWTMKELKESRRRREAGEKTCDLAAEFGVSPNALRAQWGAQGLITDIPRIQGILTPKDVADTWRRRLEGEKTEDLAAEFGVVTSALYTAWKKRGWSARSHYDYGRMDASDLWTLRSQGLSWAEVCTKKGMDPTEENRRLLAHRLRRYCLRNKIPHPEVRKKEPQHAALPKQGRDRRGSDWLREDHVSTRTWGGARPHHSDPLRAGREGRD